MTRCVSQARDRLMRVSSCGTSIHAVQIDIIAALASLHIRRSSSLRTSSIGCTWRSSEAPPESHVLCSLRLPAPTQHRAAVTWELGLLPFGAAAVDNQQPNETSWADKACVNCGPDASQRRNEVRTLPASAASRHCAHFPPHDMYRAVCCSGNGAAGCGGTPAYRSALRCSRQKRYDELDRNRQLNGGAPSAAQQRPAAPAQYHFSLPPPGARVEHARPRWEDAGSSSSSTSRGGTWASSTAGRMSSGAPASAASLRQPAAATPRNWPSAAARQIPRSQHPQPAFAETPAASSSSSVYSPPMSAITAQPAEPVPEWLPTPGPPAAAAAAVSSQQGGSGSGDEGAGDGGGADSEEAAIAAAYVNEPPPDVHVVNTLAAAQAAAARLLSFPAGTVFACDTEVMDIDVT